MEGTPTLAGADSPVAIAVGQGEEARTIAVRRRDGAEPGVLWLGGYRSDMGGAKAAALDAWAAAEGVAFTRFDYSGHGKSGGRFEDGTITRWLEEAGAVFDRMTSGRQIVVGSSMGGWLALLLAERHFAASQGGGRIAGLVLLAPAVDMTKDLMLARMTRAQQKELRANGVLAAPGRYAAEPTPITLRLIEDGERHLFGQRTIETGCPIRIVQGVLDPDVPWQHATALVARLASDDVVLTLVKDGDHRLSRPEDLERLIAVVAAMRGN